MENSKKEKSRKVKVERRKKADETGVKTNALQAFEEEVTELREANRKIAADFEDNKDAITELADWQSVVGMTISEVQRVCCHESYRTPILVYKDSF